MKNTLIIFSILLLCIPSHVFSQDKEKKIEFEVSAGVANGDTEPIYQRFDGIDEAISQYAWYYLLDYSSSGGTREKGFFIPINVSVNYLLKPKLFLKVGLDYCFSNQNNTALAKSFRVDWEDFYEEYDYQISDKVSFFMPHLGIGFRHTSFDFYGALGIGFAHLTYSEALNYAESQPMYSFNTLHTYSVKGSAPGAIIGIKYRLPLFKKSSAKGIRAIVKLEALILNVKEFSGSGNLTGSASDGERFSQSSSGTLYQFQWDPYTHQWFDYWELYDTVPTDNQRRNFEKLGINFSGIRFMVGLSF